ncbi:MAG: hypothetical protein HFJ58_06540 [Clostridia bacterium]|nr:hypothetical protein [Clostridia bacterium]
MEEYKLIDKLFKYREEDGIKDIQEDMSLLKNRVKGIKREEIESLISDVPQGNKEKILSNIDNLIADYNIMLAYYNKKYYKQGFEDALEIGRKCR